MKILRLKPLKESMIPDTFLYLIAVSVGVLFLLIDAKPRKREFHSSFIAGVAISYFFLLVLPTLPGKLPQFTGIFENFAFLAVLLGFSLVHISEKFIFHRIDQQTKQKTKELILMQEALELVKGSLNDSLKQELTTQSSDPEAIMELGQMIATLRTQRNEILDQIQSRKQNIETHINKHFYQFRSAINYFYQLFIGLIFLNLLKVDAVGAVLFFSFAFLMVTIRRKTFPQVIDMELGIYIHDENPFSKQNRILLSTSVLLGVFCGIILDLLYALPIALIYQLFSFICGIILYIVLKNDLPDRHEGKPAFFFFGIAAFSIILILAKFIESKL